MRVQYGTGNLSLSLGWAGAGASLHDDSHECSAVADWGWGCGWRSVARTLARGPY